MNRHPVALVLVTVLAASPGLRAVEMTRNLSVTSLDQSGAWFDGVAPGVGDVAVWTGSSRGGGTTNNQLNVDRSWLGVRMVSAASAVTLNGTGILTTGSAGIDLSASNLNMTFTLAGVVLAADQTWSSNAGGQLVMTSSVDLGNAARTLSIGNPDAASTTNKIVLNHVSGGSNASLTLTNANGGASPQVWIQLAGSVGTGVQTDLTISNGVLAYFGSGGSIASSSNLTILSGGVLDVSTKSTGAVSQTVATLSGSGTVTNNRSNATSNTLTVGSTSGSSTFSGALVNGVGALALTKSGESLLVLNGTNTSSGLVTAAGGSLRLDSAGALSSNANLYFSGGIVELGAGNSTFVRAFGSGSNQIRMLAGGGFGAVGSDATVSITDASLRWGSGNFNQGGETFILSSVTSTHKVTFLSDIDLGLNTPTRTIEVRNGAALIDGQISGVLKNASVSSAGSIIKTGEGTLELSAINTYTGSTTVNAGTLLLTGTLASASAVTINSGGKFSVGSGVNLSNEVTVNEGGRIGGSGTYSDASGIVLGSGAIAAPGDSPGNTVYATDLTFQDEAIFEWELGAYGVNAGVDSDLITSSGAGNIITFDSGSFLTLAFLGPVISPDGPGTGDFWLSDRQWVIATAVSGGSVIDNGLAIQGQSIFSNGYFSVSSAGNDVYLNYTYDVIPEPGTSVLFGLGLAGILCARRRYRHRVN